MAAWNSLVGKRRINVYFSCLNPLDTKQAFKPSRAAPLQGLEKNYRSSASMYNLTSQTTGFYYFFFIVIFFSNLYIKWLTGM